MSIFNEGGYSKYTVKAGDTLYQIARKFDTKVEYIMVANPYINPNNLQIGEVIIVPFGNIVQTNSNYSSDILNKDIESLRKIFKFIKVQNIGKSVLGEDLKCIIIGNGEKKVFYNAGIHANEWITSVLVMKFIENYCKAIVSNSNIFEYNARNIYNNCTLYIVPMVNPDGVNLVTNTISKEDKVYNDAKKIAESYPQIPFPNGWKANIKGVDLNLQFPANWEEAQAIKYSEGYTKPAPRDYVGVAPLTQPESVSLYNLTNMNNFRLTISFHSQGEVIYWRYLDYMPEDSLKIATEFSRVSGYTLDETPLRSSFAGYRDWFIQNFNRPGYTVEVGEGVSPLPLSQFESIYRANEGILVLGMIL